MAFHNANYEAVNLSGTMTVDMLGNGVTASTVHQVYCLAGGSIDITPLGGERFTWTASANDSINVLVREVTVNSGTFIGFKTKFYPRQSQMQNQG
jgi:hypothetical protein